MLIQQHFYTGPYSDLGHDQRPTIVSPTNQSLLGLMDLTVDYGNSRIIAPLSSSASGVQGGISRHEIWRHKRTERCKCVDLNGILTPRP